MSTVPPPSYIAQEPPPPYAPPAYVAQEPPPPYDPGHPFETPGTAPSAGLAEADISGIFRNQPQQMTQLHGRGTLLNLPPQLIQQASVVTVASESTGQSFQAGRSVSFAPSSFSQATSASASFEGGACSLCLSAPRYPAHPPPSSPSLAGRLSYAPAVRTSRSVVTADRNTRLGPCGHACVCDQCLARWVLCAFLVCVLLCLCLSVSVFQYVYVSVSMFVRGVGAEGAEECCLLGAVFCA